MTKKSLVSAVLSVVIAVAVFSIPIASFAQSTATSTASQVALSTIQQLLQQVEALQTQLGQVQGQLQTAITSFTSTLSVGSSGDQVRALQALLAADPSIYPEGVVSGYYGKLTAKAVERFQKAHGLNQAGVVGPKTRGLLDQLLEQNPIALENNNGSGNESSTSSGESGNQVCAIVPPGHLIAPGWLRKNGGVAPVVPPCQTLPPGIARQLGLTSSTPTSTVTSTPLIISGIVLNAMTSSAAISWTTNVAANSQILYGTSTSYGTTFSDGSFVIAHTETITGLTPATLYHFELQSTDATNQVATSTDLAASTQALPPLPAIGAIGVTPSSTSALISWTTNVPATSKLFYSTVLPVTVGASSTVAVDNETLVTNHLVSLGSLATSTNYGFVLTSVDAFGNSTTSAQQTFGTGQ